MMKTRFVLTMKYTSRFLLRVCYIWHLYFTQERIASHAPKPKLALTASTNFDLHYDRDEIKKCYSDKYVLRLQHAQEQLLVCAPRVLLAGHDLFE